MLARRIALGFACLGVALLGFLPSAQAQSFESDAQVETAVRYLIESDIDLKGESGKAFVQALSKGSVQPRVLKVAEAILVEVPKQADADSITKKLKRLNEIMDLTVAAEDWIPFLEKLAAYEVTRERMLDKTFFGNFDSKERWQYFNIARRNACDHLRELGQNRLYSRDKVVAALRRLHNKTRDNGGEYVCGQSTPDKNPKPSSQLARLGDASLLNETDEAKFSRSEKMEFIGAFDVNKLGEKEMTSYLAQLTRLAEVKEYDLVANGILGLASRPKWTKDPKKVDAFGSFMNGLSTDALEAMGKSPKLAGQADVTSSLLVIFKDPKIVKEAIKNVLATKNPQEKLRRAFLTLPTDVPFNILYQYSNEELEELASSFLPHYSALYKESKTPGSTPYFSALQNVDQALVRRGNLYLVAGEVNSPKKDFEIIKSIFLSRLDFPDTPEVNAKALTLLKQLLKSDDKRLTEQVAAEVMNLKVPWLSRTQEGSFFQAELISHSMDSNRLLAEFASQNTVNSWLALAKLNYVNNDKTDYETLRMREDLFSALDTAFQPNKKNGNRAPTPPQFPSVNSQEDRKTQRLLRTLITMNSTRNNRRPVSIYTAVLQGPQATMDDINLVTSAAGGQINSGMGWGWGFGSQISKILEEDGKRNKDLGAIAVLQRAINNPELQKNQGRGYAIENALPQIANQKGFLAFGEEGRNIGSPPFGRFEDATSVLVAREYARNQTLQGERDTSIVGTSDGDFVEQIRKRAEHIAGRDSGSTGVPPIDHGFLAVREEIHNDFSPAVLPKVEQYLANARVKPLSNATLQKQLITELEVLCRDLRKALYGKEHWGPKVVDPVLRKAQVAALIKDPQPVEKLKPLGIQLAEFKKLTDDQLARERKLRDSFARGFSDGFAISQATQLSRDLNAGLAQLFIEAGKIKNTPGAENSVAFAHSLVDGLEAEGLLTPKQNQEFQKTLTSIEADQKKGIFKRPEYRKFIKYIFGVAQGEFEKVYMPGMKRLSRLFPGAYDYEQTFVRQSLMLRMSQLIENLGKTEARVPYEAMSQATCIGTLQIVNDQRELEKIQAIQSILVLGPGVDPGKTPFEGVLTDDEMTEGSHTVVLCRNTDKACAQAVGASKAKDIQALVGKTVSLTVGADKFEIKAADAAAIQAKASGKSTGPKIQLKADYSLRSVTSLRDQSPNAEQVGTKAANYGLLYRTLGSDHVHEGAAIPFEWYNSVITNSGVQKLIDSTFSSSAIQDATWRKTQLEKIRQTILNIEIPERKLEEIRDQMLEIQSRSSKDGGKKITKFRMRSSSNSEDLGWFSGAGLYESVQVNLDKPDTIERGLKEVWASLFTETAYAGREIANIDHATARMGVLMHPSYNEEANGVILTRALSKDPKAREAAMRVSVNFDNLSVTNPEKNALPEVLKVSLEGPDRVEVLKKSNVKASRERVLTEAQIKQLRTLVKKIEPLFPDQPLDFEFKIVDDVVMIKQVRPYVPK